MAGNRNSVHLRGDCRKCPDRRCAIIGRKASLYRLPTFKSWGVLANVVRVKCAGTRIQAAATISETKIKYPYRLAMYPARSWVSSVTGVGSGQKTRTMSTIAANVRPALAQLAARNSDDLVQDLNR